MKLAWFSSSRFRGVLLFTVSAACLMAASSTPAATAPGGLGAPNRFIGAAKCSNCHKSEAIGNQYGKWKESKHATAFEVLASDKAKELAKARGIDDPQKSDACLKCHVTALGVAAEQIAKGFDPALGVQCESCHGPGEQHMKARVAAAVKAGEGAPAPMTEGEINTAVNADSCLKCHNSESPSFKAFCFPARHARIVHLNPGKKRDEEEVRKLTRGCTTPDCKDCASSGG